MKEAYEKAVSVVSIILATGIGTTVMDILGMSDLVIGLAYTFGFVLTLAIVTFWPIDDSPRERNKNPENKSTDDKNAA